jgi:hypothetical protein
VLEHRFDRCLLPLFGNRITPQIFRKRLDNLRPRSQIGFKFSSSAKSGSFKLKYVHRDPAASPKICRT